MHLHSQHLFALCLSAWALLVTGCDRTSASAGAEAQPVTTADKATATRPAGPELGAALPDIAARVMPSVVSVASTRRLQAARPELPLNDPWFRRFFGPESGPDGATPFPMPPDEAPEAHGLGSGVIVAPGVILTNAHVVEGATTLEITAEGKRVIEAELVGSDPKSDLAVLKIKGQSNLKPLELGDSAQLRPADVVLAIGNPFGVGQTVTMGVVSGKGRADLGIVDYEDFIQTDAAINPGNSGGALVDRDGKLVGIPTAILSRSGGYMGVGFAIPSNMARPIMESLLKHGRVTRGYLGIGIQELDPALAKALDLPSSDGVLVSSVEPGGPAARAGIHRGDVVLSVDGKQVRTTGELRNAVAGTAVGKEVDVTIARRGERRTLRAKIGELPGGAAEKPPGGPSSAAPDAMGIEVAPLDDAMRRRLQVPREIKQGVVVAAVRPGSPAARAGLRAGDVVLEFEQQAVGSPQRLSELWSKSEGAVALLVWREGRTFYVAMTH